MSLSRSWQFVGGISGWPYRFFDALRRGLNRRLVRYLTDSIGGRDLRKGEALNTAGRLSWTTLEAGSGTAFATSLLADDSRTRAAVCLDLDLEALRLARHRDPRIHPVIGDLNQLPFCDGAFTLVFSSSTLEHLEDPLPALKEMTRTCHSTGCVFVGVPYAYGPLWIQPLIRRSRWGVWIGPVFSRHTLDAMLGRSGLRASHFRRYFCRFFIGAAAEKVVVSPSRSMTAAEVGTVLKEHPLAHGCPVPSSERGTANPSEVRA